MPGVILAFRVANIFKVEECQDHITGETLVHEVVPPVRFEDL
jgi:hypothetical protein